MTRPAVTWRAKRLRRPVRSRVLAAVGSAGLALPAHALWVYDNTAPYVARAPLAFELVVEKFVFLQIGSPGTVVDSVAFSLASALAGGGAPPGSGVPLEAVSGGRQPVVVRGNQGSITLAVLGSGGTQGMSNGAGGRIGYDQVLISSSNGALPAPVLSAAGAGSVSVLANAYGGWVTDQTAEWTFRLANTAAAAGGNYSGQLTFTVSMP